MEIQGCSPDRCVNFTSCTNARPSDYPPCAKNAMESGINSVQQLQAKIRAIADGLEIAYRTADPMAVDNAVNELRELSAVQ